MDGLQTWVINLDRSPERLDRIGQQRQRLALPVKYLPAADARALQDCQRAALDEPAYRRKHGMTPVPSERGYYLLHVHALQEFLASPARFAQVLEDDVRQHAERRDMMRLSAVHSGTPVPVLEVAP